MESAKVIILFGVMCTSLCILMFTVLGATIDYAREKNIESLYRTTMCFVTSYENYADCSGGVCVLMRKYEIVYNVSDGRTIESTTIESGGPGPNSVRTFTKLG